MTSSDNPTPHTDMNFSDSLSILKIWYLALFKPSAENFREIMQDTKASMQRVQFWIFLIGILSMLSCWLTLLGQGLVETVQRMEYDEEKQTYILAEDDEFMSFDFTIEYNAGAILLICIFFIIFVISSTGLVHLVAKLLGATGNLRALLYIQFAYTFPLYLIALFIYMVIVIMMLTPLLGVILVGLLIVYQLILETIAVRLIYQLKIHSAVISVLIPVVVWGGLIFGGLRAFD